MPRLRKLFILLVILLLLPLFLANIVFNQQVGNFTFKLIPIKDYPLIGSYIPYYLFWGSILVSILLIVFFLFISFYPSNRTEIRVSKSKGSLSVKKNAIEQFVFAALFQESWLIKPKVSVTMKKKKIKIFISGNCSISNTNISDKTAELSLRIKQELQTFLGIEDDKQIAVEIKNISSDKINSQRVV